ncbi:MAG: hypothetical protein ACREX9_11000 [Gammaproteobacteria bacterium]
MSSEGIWGAVGAVAGAVAAGAAVLTFFVPDDEKIVIPPPVVPINVIEKGSDEFGFEIKKVYLEYVFEHTTYEKYFFGLLTKAVQDGYNYGLEVVLRKYDDKHYKNCEARVPGYGRVYFGSMHVNSRVGIVNDEVFALDLGKGQYRFIFTLVGRSPMYTIEKLKGARFKLVCDSMATIDHSIDLSRHSPND